MTVPRTRADQIREALDAWSSGDPYALELVPLGAVVLLPGEEEKLREALEAARHIGECEGQEHAEHRWDAEKKARRALALLAASEEKP